MDDETQRLRDRLETVEIKLATFMARQEAESEDAGNASRSRQLLINTCLTAFSVALTAVGLYIKARG